MSRTKGHNKKGVPSMKYVKEQEHRKQRVKVRKVCSRPLEELVLEGEFNVRDVYSHTARWF
ncbi:hypothetical protein AKO1_000321 [Acrasis kona]|uniref:Uncharacterized protein n=1 Tax=Acrasis kona TaxID=1008807 RepID=A0AAW2ZDN7_9EUKA